MTRSMLAWRPVSTIAALTFTVLLALSGRYGWHRDELYFRVLSDSLAWGYVDQPPLTPLVAAGGKLLLGDTLLALRLPAALCAVAAIALGALITAELGGGRTAQVLAAVGLGTSGMVLVAGHTLVTNSIDIVAWLAFALFAVRAMLRGDGRWWLAAGAACGVAFHNKYLIILLVIGLFAGLATVGPRRQLRNPWLFGGIMVALALGAPNLIYQATHDWPQLRMAEALDPNGSNMGLFLPTQFMLMGPLLLPICVAGMAGLLREDAWREMRGVGVAYPFAAGLMFLTGGRGDYVFGLLALTYLAGCVLAERWMVVRPRLVAGMVVLNVALQSVVALPVLPASVLATTPIPAVNIVARDTVGWPEYVATVTEVHDNLPAGQRERAVVSPATTVRQVRCCAWVPTCHLSTADTTRCTRSAHRPRTERS